MALELEHERGKLTGLGQSNAALREHNSILETALAKREADLVQLNLQVFKPLSWKMGVCYRTGGFQSGSCCPMQLSQPPAGRVLPHPRDTEGPVKCEVHLAALPCGGTVLCPPARSGPAVPKGLSSLCDSELGFEPWRGLFSRPCSQLLRLCSLPEDRGGGLVLEGHVPVVVSSPIQPPPQIIQPVENL